jgi:hypothetical protein
MEEEKNASSKRDKKNKKKNSRSMEDIMAAAKRAAQKATLLRKEVSRSRYEFWCDNVKLAKSLKQIFQAPGIIRAYVRICLQLDSFLPAAAAAYQAAGSIAGSIAGIFTIHV